MRRLLALIAWLWAGAAAAQAVAVAPGVWLHAGKLEDWGPSNGGDVANLGAIEGERCVAVIDTGGSLATGRAWRAQLAVATGGKPVCWVIDTHAHPDHVLGNAAFRGAGPGGADPEFVGHARLPAALAARGPYYLNALARDFGGAAEPTAIVAPTRTVAAGQVETLDLGGRRIELQAWPTAHTDADLSVFDPTSGTLFTGDLLFVEHLPALDGKLLGWLAVMDRLAARSDVRAAVPGHGPVQRQWPQALAPQRRYLEGLRDGVREALRANRSLAETVDRLGGKDIDGWQLTERFHKRNVTAAYAELEWSD